MALRWLARMAVLCFACSRPSQPGVSGPAKFPPASSPPVRAIEATSNEIGEPFVEVAGPCARSATGVVRCVSPIVAGEMESFPPPAGRYQSMSYGQRHGCGIALGGTLTCWGDIGTPPRDTAIAVSSGLAFACALATDGEVFCWGAAASSPPVGGFEQLSCGEDHCCALASSGRPACWGNPGVAPPEEFKLRSVVAGSHFACGITTDGKDVCWDSQHTFRPLGGTYKTIAVAPTGPRDVCGINENEQIVCTSDVGKYFDGNFLDVSLYFGAAYAIDRLGRLECVGQPYHSWEPRPRRRLKHTQAQIEFVRADSL